ncbi:hypothetical protein FRC08_009323 [Ceratobasidium sp. 394]|nr:hypothetical protein FRC08_009323 [Ceratobasidium sp. 394]KAG9099284.1 hypothetical protein FS749_001647 [Ceratobasidium sp. UAMH 11750]
MPSSHHLSSGARVAKVPELLAAISTYLTTGERVPLLRVSRFVSTAVAPFVWHRLDGLQNFVKLFVLRPLPPWNANAIQEVPLKNIIDFTALRSQRVIYYASLVRMLSIGHLFGGYRWLDLELLATGPPLFPNLTKIEIVHARNKIYPYDLARILSTFCTPGRCSTIRARSLMTLNPDPDIDYETPWIIHTDASLALENVLVHAPGLRHFDFFVASEPLGSLFSGWPLLVQALDNMPIVTNIGLDCNSLCVEVLLAAGRLSSLQTLTLCSESADKPSEHLLGLDILDNTLFPKLSGLVLTQCSLAEACAVFNIQPLLARVKKATLDFFVADWLDPDLDQAFHLLHVGAPCLEELKVWFPCPPEDHHDPRLLDWRDRLAETLFRIPLRRIHVRFLRQSVHTPLSHLLGGCSTWRATLTHLTLGGQCVKLSDLPTFTIFSSLEVLNITLWGLGVPEVDPRYLLRPMSSRRIRLESTYTDLEVPIDQLAR